MRNLFIKIKNRFSFFKRIFSTNRNDRWDGEENVEPGFIPAHDFILSPGTHVISDGGFIGYTGAPGYNGPSGMLYVNNEVPTDSAVTFISSEIPNEAALTVRNLVFDGGNGLVLNPASGEMEIGNLDVSRLRILFDANHWSPRIEEHISPEPGYRYSRRGIIVMENLERRRSLLHHADQDIGTHNEPAADSVHGSEDMLLGWDSEQNT